MPHRVNGYLPSVDERLVRGNAPSADEVPAAGRTRVLGYASVQEEHDEPSHMELRRQAVQIAAECERRGLHLLEVVREHERQHQRPLERPGLGYALERIATGEASGIVVAELSRVTHSASELGRVLEWLAHREARFVAAGPGLDTEEEAGRLALRAVIEVSRWERERLAERTRNGMRAARRKGPASVADHPELSERIAGMRARGHDPPSDRRPAERRRDSHGQRWRQVAPLERASSRRVPPSAGQLHARATERREVVPGLIGLAPPPCRRPARVT